ncbi:MAG TPA: DinB family protein [Bryobacteraceae bacterium]|nr:DinB family protein [Bryobacteraceae bacterium]
MKKLYVWLLAASFTTLPSFAQEGAANPLSSGQKFVYGIVKGSLIKAAEKMPEESYASKPTPDVRSYAQLMGHVADANYTFCSVVLGEKPPVTGIEKSKTAKADLVQAVKDSFAYCDKAYDGMTDADAATVVKFFGQSAPKLSILSFHTAHADEHYGNAVTYMRLKGIVPPTSERPPAPAGKSN